MITTRSTLVPRLKMRQGDAPLIRTAIEDENRAIVLAAQAGTTLTYKIWDTTSNTAPETLQAEGTIAVAGAWYDTWQPWPDDDIGFNFAHRFPASDFETAETGNRQYKVEVRGIDAFTDEPYWAVFCIIDAEDALTDMSPPP